MTYFVHRHFLSKFLDTALGTPQGLLRLVVTPQGANRIIFIGIVEFCFTNYLSRQYIAGVKLHF